MDLSSLGKKLGDLLAQIRTEDTEQGWLTVEATARSLANGLRTKDGPVDNHTILGKSDLPQTLTALFQLALHGSPIPDLRYTSLVLELLRVAANLCLDHDENRAHLLDAGLPQAIVSVMEGYTVSVPPPPYKEPFPLSIPHLKVVRTAIGVLLNASIGFEPIKFKLIPLEAAMTVMKLSTALYPPGAWCCQGSKPLESTPNAVEESWALRSSLSNWAWRTISELKDVKDGSEHVLGSEVLSLLTAPLLLYTSPNFPSASPFSPDSEIYENLLNADFEALEESCTLIESLSLDIEDARFALAKGFSSPAEKGGVPCLSVILDFIEWGEYSPLWRVFTDADRKRMEKEFDMCKAALIKAVVEMSGEEGNQDILWTEAHEEKAGGEFVYRMVGWIKAYVRDMDQGDGSAMGRDDLVICASLSLGNLARKEAVTMVLVAQPHSLAPILASPHLLSPSADIKVKHGVIGLLKHLAQSSVQSPEIHTTLGNAGVIQAISNCGIWDEKADAMADVVQVSAIGVVKHLCNTVVENTFALVLPSTASRSPPTGLSQILALVKRSDSVPVKSEGTRILVNVIKCLWSNVSVAGSPISGGPSPIANGTVDTEGLLEKHRKRTAAMRVVLSSECASALANLLGRSAKYPVLVNESVVAMSLLSTQRAGAPLVLSAILTPLQMEFTPVPPTEPPSTSTSTNSDVSSPVMATPSTHHGGRLPIPTLPLDMLISVLRNVDSPVNFQVEVRMNVCSLLLQLGRNSGGEELTRLQDTLRPVLEKGLEDLQGAQGKEEMLIKSMQRVLDTWAHL